MSLVDIVLAVLGISVLVTIHEAGHYLVARYFGMRVLKFSIGFGPTLIKHQKSENDTVFQICAIPFLAYVQIAGMSLQEEVDPNDKALFPNQGLFARMLTIAAGPIANYLTASLLVLGIALTGWPQEIPTEPMQVASLMPSAPAAKAGLKVGDTIIEANGKPIKNVDDLIKITKHRAGQPTVYLVKRGSESLSLTITPKKDGKRGVIGVVAKTTRGYEPMPLGKALVASIALPYQLTVAQLTELGKKIGEGSTEGMSGPIGMGKIVAQEAGKGAIEYLSVLMLLSVALGLFNLLPMPALDGGRLVFLVYEFVTRRKPSERVEAWVHTAGLVLLITLLVFVTIRDIRG